MKGFESQISERIDELCDIIQMSLACDNEVLDFTEYIRYGTSITLTDLDWPLTRFFLSDVFNHLSYGKHLGCVANGYDIDGQIEALQNLYSLSATVAVLPSVMLPLIKNSFLKTYFWSHTKTFKSLKKVISVRCFATPPTNWIKSAATALREFCRKSFGESKTQGNHVLIWRVIAL